MLNLVGVFVLFAERTGTLSQNRVSDTGVYEMGLIENMRPRLLPCVYCKGSPGACVQDVGQARSQLTGKAYIVPVGAGPVYARP